MAGLAVVLLNQPVLMDTFKGSRTRVLLVFLGLVIMWAPAAGAQPKARPGLPNAFVRAYKLDDVVATRSRGNPSQRSTIIVTLAEGAGLPAQFQRFARAGTLGIINSVVLDDLPNGLLSQLATHRNIASVHDNRDAIMHNYRTAMTVGARTVRETMGLTGLGIGVAVIDSGVSSFHDDLTRGGSTALYPYGDQRVLKFVDFVGGRTLPYDDNGHGSHVAGTIAGNGYDSRGEKAGIAPNASLVVLKVLDANGSGTIGNIIAALDWVAQNARTYNIRVVNMSVGASVRESYWTDPLTLAVRAVTNKGIVVVAAAGNLGKNAKGRTQYGGILAPGNAPWSLTVGASSTEGTVSRTDDVMAGYSSHGPTFIDWNAKPDLVAPGTGTVSLAVPGSTFYSTKSQYLVNGSIGTASMPYLALSGTSMAAPVVSGTVALMLQANPRLTPNLVKAILQYTAQTYPGYDLLTEGAGFLNTLGAVRLAKFYAGARAGDPVPVQKMWSRHIIWGTHLLAGGIMVPSANAWGNNIVWGTAKTLGSDGDNIVWGTAGDGDNIVWGTSAGDNIVWGTGYGNNIVWGTSDRDNIVWGTSDRDNIVWGTSDRDNIVWGTSNRDNIVWGTSDRDNIVWGTNHGDNIVWGTRCGGADCDGTVWGSWGDRDNIVWGTAGDGDNIVWGTSGSDIDTKVFPEDGASEPPPSEQDQFGDTTGGL
jgi:serine protease AprX